MENDNKDEIIIEKDDDERENRKEKREGKVYRSGLITGIIWGIGIVFALMLGSNIIASKLDNKTTGILNSSALKGSSKSSLIKEYIDKYFMEDVDSDELVEGMYKGMLESLQDPYSVYYTKEECEALNESSTGKYVGLGISVSQDNETKVITDRKSVV